MIRKSRRRTGNPDPDPHGEPGLVRYNEDMNGKRETKTLRAVKRIAGGKYMVFFRRRRHGAPQIQRLFWPIISPHYDFPSVYVMDIGEGVVPRAKGRTVVFRAGGEDFRCTEFDRWDDVYDMGVSFCEIYQPVMFAPGPERIIEKYSLYMEKILDLDGEDVAKATAWLDVQLACAGFAANAI